MTMIRSVGDHIRFQAHLRPHGLAVFGPAGPIAYQALVRDVDALMTELLERGLSRQDMVGLHLGFSYLHLLLILSLDRLSIPSMSFAVDSAAPLDGMLPQFGLTTIVSGGTPPANAPGRWIQMSDHDRPRLGQADAARLAQIDSPPDALVRVSWSSGTTGTPKGSPLTRAVQEERLTAGRMVRALGPSTRYFTGMPFSAATSYAMALAVLSAGGAVILPSPASHFVSLANALGVTLTSGPPSMLADLLGASDLQRRLDTIQAFEVLGAALPPDLARRARFLLTPNISIVYGTTETDRVASADAALCIADSAVAGFPMPWVNVQVVDAGDRPLAPAQEGQLRIRSAQTIAGYYNDDVATRRNFRGGWFYPGDVGVITAHGMLRVTGRVEEMIEQDGALVSPQSLEEALCGVAGVREVAVFASEGPGGVPTTCAALVLDAGAEPAAIRAGAAARLGDRLPARLLVVERLPRNPNGKVLRRELAALARGDGSRS